MSLLCHHKGISRLQAEGLLRAENKDGSYLIRDSETVSGAYTLCVWMKGVVHQYRILPGKDKKLFIQANEGVTRKFFSDLTQLIQQYVQRGDNNGLICALRHPVNVNKEEDNDKDSDDDDDDDDDDDSVEYRDPATSVSCTSRSEDTTTSTTLQFQKRFSALDLSNTDGAFVDEIKKYVDNGLGDDASAVVAGSGATGLTRLHSLLYQAAKPLEKQYQEFISKVEICQQLFSPGRRTSSNVSKCSPGNNQSELGLLLDKLSSIRTEISSLDKKAVNSLRDLSSVHGITSSHGHTDEEDVKSIILNTPKSQPIPPVFFKVKLLKGLHIKDLSVTLDLYGGKLILVRPNKDMLEAENMPTHDKIEQLIKSNDNNCRLDVKIEGRKKETYIFEDAKTRENFCQLIQQMKNIHAPADQVDSISVYVGTWNMGDDQPPFNLNAWLKCSGTGKSLDKSVSMVPHDVYVIGTQESAVAEKDWISKVKKSLDGLFGVDLYTIASTALWGIRLVILTKAEHKNKISHVATSFVRTGIANTLGNKGAVGISFSFLATSLCFVCAHLTSGNEKNHRRNHNFRDITKGLALGNKQLSLFDLTKQFHHLFWLGDLNYRVEEKIEVILQQIKLKDYESLLERDQLMLSKQKNEAFQYFCEEPITFPPTYRFEKNCKGNIYAWKKFKKTGVRINVPSWCDRVLWKSYPETYFKCRSYGCVEDFITSDHKPVFSSFEIGIASQFSSKDIKSSDQDTEIIFEFCQAELITNCKQNFQLEFFSPCLETHVSSKPNMQFTQLHQNYCCPRWTKNMIPTLKPIVPDRNYLEDQHILVAVKSVEVNESYGECVIAIKPYFSIYPVHFECILTHQAEETGVLRGALHVRIPPGAVDDSRWSKRSRKSYDFISCENDSKRNSENSPSLRPKDRNAPPAPLPRGHSVPVTGLKSIPSSSGDTKPCKDPFYAGGTSPVDDRPPLPLPTDKQREVRPPSHSVSAGCGSTTDLPADQTYDRLYDDVPVERAGEEEAPPMPPRRVQSLESETYCKIFKHKSIAEWLTDLHFSQYIRAFQKNGWDSLSFLNDLTDEDLVKMGIHNPDHRRRILGSISALAS